MNKNNIAIVYPTDPVQTKVDAHGNKKAISRSKIIKRIATI